MKLPGLAGTQIVLRLGSGAANEFYDVIAARDGILTTIAAPEPDYAWNEGGTVGTGTHGRFCRGGTLHAWYARGVVRHGNYVGERLTLKRYVWGASGWQLVGGFSGRVTDRRSRSLLRVPENGLWGCG